MDIGLATRKTAEGRAELYWNAKRAAGWRRARIDTQRVSRSVCCRQGADGCGIGGSSPTGARSASVPPESIDTSKMLAVNKVCRSSFVVVRGIGCM